MSAETHPYKHLGKRHRLIEGEQRVTGRERYTADLQRPGMLYARPVLSPHAFARINGIDTAAAAAAPGVVAVLTAADLVTRNRVIASRNSAVLARDRALFLGQPVAVVLGETAAAAQDGADLVSVDYEPLPAIVDVLAAMAPDAPIIWPDGFPKSDFDLSAAHANVDKEGEKEQQQSNIFAENHYSRGDIEQGFAEADLVVSHTYRTQVVHQGYLEPHACLAEPDPLGKGVIIYTATQGQFLVRDEVAQLLGLPVSQVRVVPLAVGGAFGAKYGILEPLTAALALAVQRPVQLLLSRAEDFLTTTPAHATVIDLKTGVKKDGALTALQARIVADNGVFAFPVVGIIATLLGGYYKCPHLQIDGFEVITNKPQMGAYRAPGAPQATFAIESNMDEMARLLELDPLAFRLQNAAETGDPMGNGRPWPAIGLKQCLETMREHPAWRDRHTEPNEGIGLAIGGWPAFMTPSATFCKVDSDGSVTLQLGTVDISGANSSFVLVAAEVLGVAPEQVSIIQGDTQTGPYGPNSGGSQVTYSMAGAVAGAAEEARRKLLAVAADEFEASDEDIELVDGAARVKGVPDWTIPIGQLVRKAQSKRPGPGPIVGEGHTAVPENAPGFVAHLVKVRVDLVTGEVRPVHYLAVQDVGFALNPTMVEGQMQGGAIQGLGWGMYEAMRYTPEGQLLSGSFMDYGLPRADMVPAVETILVENPSPHGPFGARGVGEPPITAGAAALANAVRDAAGVRLTELPITAEALWRARNGS